MRGNQLKHSKPQFSSTASLKPAGASPTKAFHPALPDSAHHHDHARFGEQMLTWKSYSIKRGNNALQRLQRKAGAN